MNRASFWYGEFMILKSDYCLKQIGIREHNHQRLLHAKGSTGILKMGAP